MFKLLKNLTKKDYALILVSTLLIVGQVWLDLKLPDYMAEITTIIQSGTDSLSGILKNGGYMLLCAGGSLVSAVIVGYITSYISASFSASTRAKVYQKVEDFGMEEIKGFSTSSLITRTTNDITNIQMLLSMGLQLIIKAPITAVWAIFKILNKGWQWSVITGVAVFVLLFMVVILMVLVIPKFKVVQKLIDKINNTTREQLTGIRVVRAFNAEEYQENKFADANMALTKTQLFNQRMMSIMSPVMYLIMNLLTLGIYFIGASLINEAGMLDKIGIFSNMVVFSSYAMQVIMAFLMLSMIFIMYPRASVSVMRINEVLNTTSSIKEGNKKIKTDTVGKVEFKNVSFKYPDGEEYVLKNISFVANKGDTVAFIGSTGSGKSTLVNLLLRFYDVTEGQILIDDVDIKDYKLHDLYNKFGYVPQKAVMFRGSVAENVGYGENKEKEITKEKIIEAVRVAQAEEFVTKLEGGYDYKIARGGTNLSGGQKQRISIARAIARDPEIFIFDDCFSALDYKTDYLLRHELHKYTKDATSLIVAQRIGTIKNADLILVLDSGDCIGKGTHKELLKTCQVYQEIAYSQATKEELENE